MNPIRLAIERPVGVAVGVIFVVMFGIIGVGQIPIQLTPTVDNAIITVTTSWPGRSPQEVVDAITQEQEEFLKSLPNLKSMRSNTSEGSCEITLEFNLGTDLTEAKLDVSNALRQVPTYPEEVDEPAVTTSETSAMKAIAWVIFDVDPATLDKHQDFDITTIQYAIEKEIKPYLERVDGIARVNVFGGRRREVRVLLDPNAMALRGLNHVEVIEALRGQNRDTTAGSITEGKRDHNVRVVGEFSSPEEILDTPVAYRGGKPVYVRDIGTVEVGHARQRGFVRSFGQPSLAMNAIRKNGANVVEAMEDFKARLDEVRESILPNIDPSVGRDLRMTLVYDETTYIRSAVGLVTQNLWIGGSIAALVLLLFLRSFVATGIIVLAIPISIVGTFLVLLVLGRSLNVVSLAGLAFAVGMVVDNAIVVLENIYRRRAMGESPLEAAYNGGSEVWGAVLASTLTTVVVFVPVLTIREEAGQLFRDISLAIVAAVLFSLVVSVLVIPAASSRWLGRSRTGRSEDHSKHAMFGIVTLCAALVELAGKFIHWSITDWRGWSVRPAVIIGMTAASLFGAWVLMPPLDYLPAGNRNLVFGGLSIPPGISIERRASIAQRIEEKMLPYARADINDPASVAALDPIPPAFGVGTTFDAVPIEEFFIGAFGSQMFVGATSQDDQVVIPIGELVTGAMNGISSDYMGGAGQASLFGGTEGGNVISIEVSGPDLARVIPAAEAIYNNAGFKYGFGSSVRSTPGHFTKKRPETRVRVSERGRELGLTSAALGTAVRGLFDGAFVGDYQLDGDPVDLVVLPFGGRLDSMDDLASIPISTPSGHVVPIDDVVEFSHTASSESISRIEQLPSVTVTVDPPIGVAIEEVMNDIERDVIAPVRARGLIDPTMRIRLEGTAAKLDEVKKSLLGDPDSSQVPAFVASAGGPAAGVIVLGGLVLAIIAWVRLRGRSGAMSGYAAVGALIASLVLAYLTLTLGQGPHLLTARFVWALAVTYLLMCALFESFVYPFVIMFTVPLAIVGGFAGLRIVHNVSVANPVIAPQNLDVLTMLGFVILVGVVVNNAILIVHQTLNFMKGAGGEDPMEANEAVERAVRTRVRPIFMSTLTSVGGMLPLVLFPGAGSEMYKGLGSVVVGGLIVSTVFTLVLVPLLLSAVIEMQEALRAAFEKQPQEAQPTATPSPEIV
jgi:hydrophobic/amphiphilic exporter-1 (mainly G- bacteria), HAE1 family